MKYISPEQARQKYHLEPSNEDEQISEIERELRDAGIAAIEMPVSQSDFQALSDGFGVAIKEWPELLKSMTYKTDARYGSDAGYTRKEAKYSQQTGLQTSDPKSYFHFTEKARTKWQREFERGPKVLRDFIGDGYEIHNALVTIAKKTVSELEGTHPNISKLYFPEGLETFSWLRLLRYDGYEVADQTAEVAKPHYDIAGITIQAYADAPGFWGAHEGVNGARTAYDTANGEAYTFLGKGHEKVYGKSDSLRPLWHGVDRIIPAGLTYVPERTAVILFLDAPEVDYHVSSRDTLPQLQREMAQCALK